MSNMARYSPGDYILYRQSDSNLKPWPAVIYADGLAPPSVQSARCSPYHTLILLLGQNLEFRYVLPADMLEWNPFFEIEAKEAIGHVTGLGQAFQQADDAMDAGLNLEYWRSKVKAQEKRLSPTPEPDIVSVSDCESEDKYLREAIKLSLVEHKRKSMLPLPTLSLPPPDSRKRRRTSAWNSAQQDQEDLRQHFVPFIPPAESIHSLPDKADVADKQIRQHPLRVKAEDVVEDEISESSEFVEFIVGPERERFSIPKKEIDRRDYFRCRHHGYLLAKGEKTWAIDMPCFQSILPEDFSYVADYLQTGDFGHRVIDDENQRQEAMAQCVTAWEIGERLGMEDLLDLIADKTECMTWTPEEILAFAVVVYRTEGTPLTAYERMKDMLASYLADHLYDLIKDHANVCINRLEQLPELERDIHQKKAEKANQRLESSKTFG